MRLLGIDWGEKRIGLALGDLVSGLAVPYGVIQADNQEDILSAIKKLIAAENIELIVVGEPKSMSGQNSPQTDKAQEFIRWLKDSLSVKVETMDERLTTKRSQLDQGTAKRSPDELAAMYLLQDYLERLKI